MGFISAEEVTLPCRFLTMTAHLIAVITVLFDLNALTSQMLLADPSQQDIYTQLQFTATRKTLHDVAWASIACFIVEYLGLFLGVSLFLRAHNCLYILLHFVGTILVAVSYSSAWAVGAFIAFFVSFSALPATLELLTFLVVTRSSLRRY